jgi:trans-2-enoyl-CoA reductase
MSRRPITIPSSLFLFNDIRLRGFWLTKWLEEHSAEEAKAMYNHLFDLLKKDPENLRFRREKWNFHTKFMEALNRAREPMKSRKVLLTMQ